MSHEIGFRGNAVRSKNNNFPPCFNKFNGIESNVNLFDIFGKKLDVADGAL
jgi:hypothetical protein